LIWRIRDRATFDLLRRRGCRARHGAVSVTFLAEDLDTPSRVAYVAGTRVGKAVVRNRVRRRLRSIMVEFSNADGPAALRSGAYLVRADPKGAALTFDELKRHVGGAVAGAHQRFDSGGARAVRT